MKEFTVTRGKVKRAVRCVLYGVAGVGKSTWCAHIPDALFIDTETGTSEMDVGRLPCPETWADLQDELDFIIYKQPCSTLVIDTIDRVENLLIQNILEKDGKGSIEDYGYGKGYVVVQERWQKEFLFKLDKVIAKGINVVLVCHSISRKIETPEETAFDHWELNLSRKVAPVTRDWADMMLFCNFDMTIIDTSKNSNVEKRKATGSLKRKIHCNQKPQFDAKNRYGLADSYDLSFEPFKGIFDGMVKRSQERTQIDIEAPNTGIVDEDNPITMTSAERLLQLCGTKGISADQLGDWLRMTGRPELENASDVMLNSMITNIDLLAEQIKGGK